MRGTVTENTAGEHPDGGVSTIGREGSSSFMSEQADVGCCEYTEDEEACRSSTLTRGPVQRRPA